MATKPFNFDEFRTESLTLKSRSYTLQADMGLTMTPATKGSAFLVTLSRLTGDRLNSAGTMVANATHYAITDDSHSVVNGDICTDSGGINYEILYYEHVSSFMGSYDGMWLKEIRQ